MVFKRLFICACLLSVVMTYSYSQSVAKWSLYPALEVNYTGYNSLINLAYTVKEKHVLEAGASYNMSDGFTANPTIGINISYRYKILASDRWSAAMGIDYRRQKPLDIVNIQMLCYTLNMTYRATKSISIHTRLGYGVAAERARSAGSFTQSNNITGLFQIGCGYHL
jgi:long-subunit fatty acid transport protein